MPYERLKPRLSIGQEQLEELKKIVPEAFADGKINWQTLKEALGEFLEDEGPEAEHFGLFWPGKREARRMAAIPSKGTLVPVPGEGIDEETTRNIFIEGENLEVLKLLQKSYAGRIKMIYIDEPYNTGKDHVYEDDFREPLEEYLRRAGQIDEEGKFWSTNTRADGRFHSKWLSMMYPRLKLARNLLRDDGVIFVSTGDQELHHLRQIMNELFGEEAFLANFIWFTEGHTDNQLEVKVNHEYILCYRKVAFQEVLQSVVDPNTRKESNLFKGFAENSITKNGQGNPPSEVLLPVGFPCKVKDIDLQKTNMPKKFFEEVERLGYISREITRKYECEYPIRLDPMNVRDYRLTKECRVYSGWANVDKLKMFIQNNCNPIPEPDGEMRFFLSENGVVYYRKDREKAKNILSVLRGFMTTEKMRSLLEDEGIFFSYPKPVDLVRYICQLGASGSDIILDFFAGSGTTGHAVYEMNKANGTNCRFILVQLNEPTSPTSLAYQKGFKTIPQICLKRLKVFSRKLQTQKRGDFGFTVLKLSTSNFKIWQDYDGTNLKELESKLDLFETPLVDNWKPENLLTEILLLEGFPLDSKIEKLKEHKKNTVNHVSSEFCEHHLLVCLDPKIEQETVQHLKFEENDVFVCLDSALSDQDKMRLADVCKLKTI